MQFRKDVENVPQAHGKLKVTRNMLVIGVLVAVIIFVMISNLVTSASARSFVDVAVLKTSVDKNERITEANIVVKKMAKTEYNSYSAIELANGDKKRSIATFDDRDTLVDTYAQYHIREGTPLYWDALTKTTPKKHSYMYQMDGELLKVDGLDSDMFGEIIVPGDKVNIRVIYTDNTFKLPSEEEYQIFQETGLGLETAVPVQKKLFNEATIIDFLNKAGESIYDEYYRVLEMPKKEQVAYMATAEFKDKTTPSTTLFVVTAEEADAYQQIGNKGPKYMATLLPRTGSNLLLDALTELKVGFAREDASK